MQTLGFVLGDVVIACRIVVTASSRCRLIVLGLIEFATAIGTIVWVREGRAAESGARAVVARDRPVRVGHGHPRASGASSSWCCRGSCSSRG